MVIGSLETGDTVRGSERDDWSSYKFDDISEGMLLRSDSTGEDRLT